MIPKITLEEIAEGLRVTGGFISQTAKKLNCSQESIYKKIAASEELQRIRNEIRESYLDLAETKLIKKINEGEDLGAICFYLKCQGKHRGYVEKQQVEHSGDANNPLQHKIQIEFVKADAD